MNNESAPFDSFFRALKLLALTGLAFSAMLLYHHVSIHSLFQQGPSSCSINEVLDCDKVAIDAWSEFLGFPIASYGLAFFALLLCFSFFRAKNKQTRSTAVVSAVFLLAGLASLESIVLFLHSVLSIGALCPYCLVIYIVNIGLLIAAVFALKGQVPFGQAARDGLSFLFSFFGAQVDVDDSSRRDARLFLGLFVLALALSLSLPRLLDSYVFSPAVKARESAIRQAHVRHKQAAIDHTDAQIWKRQNEKDLRLRINEDPSSKDFFIGPADAEIVMVEFSDYECPYCQKMAPALKAILARHPDVLFVHKHYPLDKSCNPYMKRQGHEFACKGAIMARCAGAQSDTLHWYVHDALFSLPRFSDERLELVAQEFEIDMFAFNACRNDPQVQARIQEDIEDGMRLGISGTPSIFINGKIVKPPRAELIESIILELKK